MNIALCYRGLGEGFPGRDEVCMSFPGRAYTMVMREGRAGNTDEDEARMEEGPTHALNAFWDKEVCILIL